MPTVRIGYSRKVPRAQYSTEGYTIEVELSAEETGKDWKRTAEKLRKELREKVDGWLDRKDNAEVSTTVDEQPASKPVPVTYPGPPAADKPFQNNGKPPSKRVEKLMMTMNACSTTTEFEEVCSVIRQQASKLDSHEMLYLRDAASRRRAELMQSS